MLIPQFKLNQDQKFIIIQIRLPYIKVTACQFYIQRNSFKFYLKPYLLCLTFQQSLKQVQQPAKAVYNHDKYILTVYVEKMIHGQWFENLNLLANVLKNKKENKKNKTLIQLIGQNTEEKEIKGDKLIQQKEKYVINKNKQSSKLQKQQNKHINKIKQAQQKQQQQQQQQQINLTNNIKQTQQSHSNLSYNQYNYGFCCNYSNVFKNLQQQLLQLFSFDPSNVCLSDRFQFLQQTTITQFDYQSYLYDKQQNSEQINRISSNNNKQIQSSIKELINKVYMNQPLKYEQFKKAIKMPRKQLILQKNMDKVIYKQLISIVFVYLYELICMQGEMGVQSAKTINKTSAIFSGNVLYLTQSLQKIIYNCSLRCITYSLYRHISICIRALQIIQNNLQISLFIGILHQLRSMFQKSQPRYLLNLIYLDDYLIYLFKKIDEKQKQIDMSMFLSELKGIIIEENNFLEMVGTYEEDQIQHQQKQIQVIIQQSTNINNIADKFQQLLQID